MSDPDYEEIRSAVRKVCANFDSAYWRDLDRDDAYPTEFVKTLTDSGYLSVLIPEEFGGSGLPVAAGCAILEEINRSGGNAAACHAQMYTMGTVLRHSSTTQKKRFLPKIATGQLRLQAFAVTESESGSDTTSIKTVAVRDGDRYIINGRKIFISRVEHSDLMLLLARTSPRDESKGRTAGMSVFLVDLHEAIGNGLTVKPVDTMMNHACTELFFDDLSVPAENLVGEEGNGFHQIVDGMNVERILIAAECIGNARWFIDTATEYAKSRHVFGRAIGQNQGIQFALARDYIQTEAAALMTLDAAAKFDAGGRPGSEANMAKLLASEAAWTAADNCMQTLGGYGVAKEYDVERKFRDTRLFKIAPLSTNLVLSHIAVHNLDLPRSY